MEKLKSFNFIDLFAGAGGISCGMEMAGHQCLLGVDFDQHAMNTFALNHKQAATFCGNIEDLTEKALKKIIGQQQVHVVLGGPPCQGLSTIGLGDPSDKRNQLFLQFCRIVKITQPYFLVMENVTGLLAKKNEKVLKKIFKKFHELGYQLNVQVIQAQKYGVPEKRRRTIIIGSRLNQTVTFPLPTHDIIINQQYIPPVTVGEAFSQLASFSGDIHNHDLASAAVKSTIDCERIKKIPEGKGIRYQEDEERYFPPQLRLQIDWSKIPENRLRQMRYQRLSRNLPGPTILTHRHTYYHPIEPRFLTPREAAKIQSFPNDFIFTGPVTSQWRQIGNAVPPLLGKVLGEHLKNLYQIAMKEMKKEKNLLKGKAPVIFHQSVENSRKKAFIYKNTETDTDNHLG